MSLIPLAPGSHMHSRFGHLTQVAFCHSGIECIAIIILFSDVSILYEIEGLIYFVRIFLVWCGLLLLPLFSIVGSQYLAGSAILVLFFSLLFALNFHALT